MAHMKKDNQSKKKNTIFTAVTILVAIILGYFIYFIMNNIFEKDAVVNTSTYILDQNKNNEKDESKEIKTVSKGKTNVNNQGKKNIIAKQRPLENKVEKEKNEARKVKGIYITGPRAGSTKYMDELINLVDTTELNTMVIDIKNDSGEVTYKMDADLVEEIGAGVGYISDIEGLIKKLKEKNIYLIARIVAFKDPILAAKKQELSLKNKDGTIFKDDAGLSWVNPYKKEVWDYLIDIGTHAANLGFDEIQFDYIRFSTDSGMKNVDFGEEAKNKTKMQIITEFTKYAYEALKPLGVFVSADVFGAIINSETDANTVGQSYVDMSKYLDYISPMIYPSHYSDGSYGIKYPDLEPYKLILAALGNSKEVLSEIKDQKVIVRPWLQDFTATWIPNHKTYRAEEIRDQINAVYDAGYDEWILWNGSNEYTESGLLKNE